MSTKENDTILENQKELEEEVVKEIKLKVKCECEPNLTDDDSDSSPEAQNNGNIPIGYPSDGPEWFGSREPYGSI